jgi:asparagine synthase (glutamine-hydrolysing)
MSVVFGEWGLNGRRVELNVARIQTVLSQYAPDSFESYETPVLTILHAGLHTTPESRQEIQPVVSRRGAVISWTGRLDDRQQLIHQCGLAADTSDAEVVAAAYDHFGTECLARLAGDWTLSICDPDSQTLLLARDPIGSLPLYFSVTTNCIRWSSSLEALMISTAVRLELNEAYVAGWLRSFPATDLTPYRGISSVPPASLVRIYRGAIFSSRYWEFSGTKSVRYKSDYEYEEHFRGLFRQAVTRRIRTQGPILAELSGGVDSSSIVCMADRCLKEAGADTAALETISYFDDSEPNWNERKNFTIIEDLRGRSGAHIDCRETWASALTFKDGRLAPTPGSGKGDVGKIEQVCQSLFARGHRVLLSGIGGDEVLGGVPTPFPELEDLLASCRFGSFLGQTQKWSLSSRRSGLALMSGTVRRFLPRYSAQDATQKALPWLDPDFRTRNAGVLGAGYERVRLLGDRPSFQENLQTLASLQRQLGSLPLAEGPSFEKRYPYLDRDLLEFLFAVPREQIVRPGDRRSLMRRALTGLVPHEVLYQKRKASAVRGPVQAVSAAATRMLSSGPLLMSSFKFVVPALLSAAVEKVRSGESTQIVPLIRVIALEGWLRNLCHHGVIPEPANALKPVSARKLETPPAAIEVL